MQLKWELGSPVFGLLLRRYAPHDTYEARTACLAACLGSLLLASHVQLTLYA